ncbi:Dabb family protein, partial [Pseudomonas sp. BGM005]|nr:Dabb family protein [Pseudomonas sp. BG5]
MILHCVFLRLKTAMTIDDKQALFAAIVALKQVIPGIV